MNKTLISGLAILAALSLSACGSSSGSPSASSSSPTTPASSSPALGGSDAASVKAAIKAEILASESSSPTNPFKMNAAQADCTANVIVDGVGVTKLHAYGLLSANNKLTTMKFNAARSPRRTPP